MRRLINKINGKDGNLSANDQQEEIEKERKGPEADIADANDEAFEEGWALLLLRSAEIGSGN
jgi:hypothetical protein